MVDDETWSIKSNKSFVEVLPKTKVYSREEADSKYVLKEDVDKLLPDKIWIDDPSGSPIFIMSGVTNTYMGSPGTPSMPYTWNSLGVDEGEIIKIKWNDFEDRPLISKVNFSYPNAKINTTSSYGASYDSTNSTIDIMKYISENFVSLFSSTVYNIIHASEKVSCTLRIWFFINCSTHNLYVISGNPGLDNYFDVDIVNGQITRFKNV